jgi:hypothetical protein
VSDAVNHPAHYGGEDDPYEVIKVAEAWGFDEDAYLFQVLKYIRRDKNDQLEDLKKAQFFLSRRIERLEGKTIPAGSFTDSDIAFSKSIASGPIGKAPRYSCYISVKISDNSASYTHYAIHAHKDWTVETLASLVATGAKQENGSYIITTRPSNSLELYQDIDKNLTVSEMLEIRPPDAFDYGLRKVS